MKIYNYHPITLQYLGECIADESPLEPGVYHIPAFATTINPLKEKDGFVIIFNNTKWEYVEIPEVVIEEEVEQIVYEELDAPTKLKNFLLANPDVIDLLQ
jgi:hypothetical protein